MTAARDLFLLNLAIGGDGSMKVAALTFDAVVARLGEPGAGYDPAETFRVARECSLEPRRLYAETEAAGGVAALKAGGWLP